MQRTDILWRFWCWLTWHDPVYEREPRHSWDHPRIFCRRCGAVLQEV